MSKYEFKKKNQLHKNILKNKNEKKLIRGQLKIWFDLRSIADHVFFGKKKKLKYSNYFDMFFLS